MEPQKASALSTAFWLVKKSNVISGNAILEREVYDDGKTQLGQPAHATKDQFSTVPK